MINFKKIIKIPAAALFIVFTFSLSPSFINPVQADSSMPQLQIPDLNINFSRNDIKAPQGFTAMEPSILISSMSLTILLAMLL